MKKTESIRSVKRVLQEHVNSIESNLALIDKAKSYKYKILNNELNLLLDNFPLNTLLSSIDNNSLNNIYLNTLLINCEEKIKKQHNSALQHISIYEKELITTEQQLLQLSNREDTSDAKIIEIQNKISATAPGKFSPYEDIFQMEKLLKIDWQELLKMSGLKKFYHTKLSSQSYANKQFIDNILAIDKEDYLDYKQNRHELFGLHEELTSEQIALKERIERECEREKQHKTISSHKKILEQKIKAHRETIQKNELDIWSNLSSLDKAKKVIIDYENKTDKEFLNMALQLSNDREAINDFVAKYIKISQIISQKPHKEEEKLLSQVKEFNAGMNKALSKMSYKSGEVKIDLDSINDSAERVNAATKQIINNYEKNTQNFIGFAGLSLAMYGLFNFDMIEEKIEQLSSSIDSSGHDFIGDVAQFALFSAVFDNAELLTNFDDSFSVGEISTAVSDSISSISDFSCSSSCDSGFSSSFD